jgi:hypothetical protein
MAVLWALKNKFSCIEFPVDKSDWKKFGLVLAVASLVIAGPFLVKSFYYTGTPFYPFGLGMVPPQAHYSTEHWQAILQKAADSVAEKDAYGHGRTVLAFIKHFWLIAVPERGVNNAFDYPVGLIYVLMLLPFAGHVVQSLRTRKLPVLSVIVMLWWMSWWFGSQQTRFLIVPVCLLIIVAISYLPKISQIFMILIVLVLGLEVVSLVNAHHHDWHKPAVRVLRDKDKQLLQAKPSAEGVLELNFPDAAFASWPVKVTHTDSVYIIP